MNPIDYQDIDDNTPILVAAGQHVEREATLRSPMEIAAVAAQNALLDAGLKNADAVDSIAVVRLFSDSVPGWATPLGRSNNPPQSIASRIGAKPTERIYSEVCGTQPVSLLLEACKSIHNGEKQLAMLVGVEAIANQKHIERQQLSTDWNEQFDEALEDRGYGSPFISPEETNNGLFLPMYFYALIENARAHKLGLSNSDYAQTMGQMFSAFSSIAAENPYSQFPASYSPTELTESSPENYLLCSPYTKRLVAQDRVNQSAALLVCSVGKARELGIDPAQWLFPHGFAQGCEHPLVQRPDLGGSDIMKTVARNTLAMAGTSIDDVDLIDIYSCFPCAVSTVCDALQLPTDGSRTLTLTGGLPFFGGPGNNYSMHGLAEMSRQLRGQDKATGFLSANGGVLTKHAAIVLSRQHRDIDWSKLSDTELATSDFASIPIATSPTAGKVLSYTVQYQRGNAQQVVIIAEHNGERFVATSTSEDDISRCEAASPIGASISVTSQEGVNTFRFQE